MPKTDPDLQFDWRPTASLEILKLRATLLARIRSFLSQVGAMEVQTPVLSVAASTDPVLESFATRFSGPGSAAGQPLYLHTSPEYYMKRLLAAGSGAIFQLAPVFRNGELGRRHNPEFLLLEWYQPGYDHHALMDELETLLGVVLEGFETGRPVRRVTYRTLFRDHCGFDPWNVTPEAIKAFCEQKHIDVSPGMEIASLDSWLDLVLTHWIEARMGDGALLVYDYPPSQAALARITGDVPVAERFELYIDGVELANGFHELTDAKEQQQRLEAENEAREQQGLLAMPIDEKFIAALASGLPNCAGVALGFDRLVMLAAAASDIETVLPFGFERV